MSVEFDGVDDYFLAISSLIVSPPFSVSAWFYPISTKGTISTTRVFAVYGGGANRHECRFNASGPQTLSAVSQTLTEAVATTANGCNADEWNHGLWTLDTSLRTVALNGGVTAGNTTTRSPTLANTGIAGPAVAPAGVMTGRIADLAVWNIDLSLDSKYEEIKRALSKGFSPYAVHPGNLIAWFRFFDENPVDVVGSFSITANGAPFKAAHPRLIPPRHTGKKILQGVTPVIGVASVTGRVKVAGRTQSLAFGTLVGTATVAASPEIWGFGALTAIAMVVGDGRRLLVPLPEQVRAGVVYESNDLPQPRDVRDGVMYGLEDAPLVGTLILPDPSDVRCGVAYGAPDS